MDMEPVVRALLVFLALLIVSVAMLWVLETEGDALSCRAIDAPQPMAPPTPVLQVALALAPVNLEPLVVRTIGRWTATPRRWLLGHTDDATVSADDEALTSAIDGIVRVALCDTDPGDAIDVSIERDRNWVSVVVAHNARSSGDKDQAPLVHSSSSERDPSYRSEAHTVPTLLQAVARAHAGSISETRIGCRRLYRLRLPVASPLSASA